MVRFSAVLGMWLLAHCSVVAWSKEEDCSKKIAALNSRSDKIGTYSAEYPSDNSFLILSGKANALIKQKLQSQGMGWWQRFTNAPIIQSIELLEAHPFGLLEWYSTKIKINGSGDTITIDLTKDEMNSLRPSAPLSEGSAFVSAASTNLEGAFFIDRRSNFLRAQLENEIRNRSFITRLEILEIKDRGTILSAEVLINNKFRTKVDIPHNEIRNLVDQKTGVVDKATVASRDLSKEPEYHWPPIKDPFEIGKVYQENIPLILQRKVRVAIREDMGRRDLTIHSFDAMQIVDAFPVGENITVQIRSASKAAGNQLTRITITPAELHALEGFIGRAPANEKPAASQETSSSVVQSDIPSSLEVGRVYTDLPLTLVKGITGSFKNGGFYSHPKNIKKIKIDRVQLKPDGDFLVEVVPNDFGRFVVEFTVSRVDAEAMSLNLAPGVPVAKTENAPVAGEVVKALAPPVTQPVKVEAAKTAEPVVAAVHADLPQSEALNKLNAMPGLEHTTLELGKIREFLVNAKQRTELGLKVHLPMLHARFDGNPGTGKTTVARLYGEMLSELGFLKQKKDKPMPVIERSGSDFVSPDAEDKMRNAIAKADGGVLILDELYTADVKNNRHAQDAAAVLLKAMEDNRDRFIVIGTGYQKEMDDFISSNDGFASRFTQKLNFEDYSDHTLALILKKMAVENDYHIEDNVIRSAVQRVSRERGTKGFGNARKVRNEFEAAIQRQAARLVHASSATKEQLQTLTLADFQPPKISIGERLAALDHMVGLDEIKQNFRAVASHLQIEQARANKGLKSDRPLLNAVFEGNPGTGKTTVAKMYGSLLRDLGYVSKGEFIYVKAGELLGDAVGVSTTRATNLLRRAKGNVLFIDEAYLLFRPEAGGSNSYGREVLDVLVAEINPDANQDMVVMLGGYRREMANMMSANSGLARRFPNNFHFADYTPEQLLAILRKKAKEKGFTLAPESERAAQAELSLRRSAKDFGNAGDVENLLGAAQLRQSERLSASGKADFSHGELTELHAADFRGPRRLPDEVLKELDTLPGYSAVKQALHDIKDTNAEAALLDESSGSLFNCCYGFEGHSPVEQKKVAEILGRLLHTQGILPKESIEVAASTDLKGSFIGESMTKTNRILENSLGKTLFIGELSAISNPHNPYEKEVLDTLANFLERNHGKMAVVFSGTPDEIKLFEEHNPRLAGKIEQIVEFHGPDSHEALAHLGQLLQRSNKPLSLSPAAVTKLQQILPGMLAEPGHGNLKFLEDFKSRLQIKHAVRAKRDADVNPTQIDVADIDAAIPNSLTRRRPRSEGLPPPLSSSPPPPESTHLAPRTRSAEEPRFETSTHTKTAKHEAEPTPKEQPHEHLTEHVHDVESDLRREGIEISSSAKKLMLEINQFVDPKNEAGNQELKESIKKGELSPALLQRLARQLKIEPNAENMARLEKEVTKAIKEFKDAAQRLNERAKTDPRAKKLVKHYVCLACGRTTCNFMPYTWFTEE